MSISFRCPGCDTSHSVKNVLAGKRVRCKCGKQLLLPVKADAQVAAPSQPTQAVSVRCRECGKTYRANEALAGKKVRCKCGAVVHVPVAAPESPASPLGDFLDDALNEPIGPASPPAGPQATLPREDTEQQRKPSRGRKKKPEFDTDVLTTVTAILCIIHGLARIGSLYYMPRLILSGHVFSLAGILGLCSFVVTVGIAAAGVGLLLKQTWALPIGSAAAIAYFGLMGISLFMLLVAFVRSDSGLGLGIFVSMIPWIVAESVTPGLLLHLSQRDQE